MAEKKQEQGVLRIGVDLGTSRTAISCSNGVRTSLPSFVGYPKDVVSRKLLGKEVLFGEEAIEHRLSLDLYRPLEKGVLKTSLAGKGGKSGKDDVAGNQKAARDLIGEAVRLAEPRRDQLVYAVIGVPAQASIANKEAILEAAKHSVDSVMLCSEPFSVAYGLDMLDHVLVIDIGAGTTDLCRMHGTMPEEADQVTLELAGDFVDQQLSDRIRAAHPEAQFSIQMVKSIKEQHGSVTEKMEPALVKLPVKGKPTEFDLSREIRDACSLLVAPIVEGLAELVATFDPEFQEHLKNRVLLAGGGSQIKGLDRAIERHMQEQLGSGRVVHVEEPVYGGANGALKIAQDMPDEFWEKLR
ncbi:MAG TPA: MamK family actin-like protein [Planctomycetota bacterium]|nr:MamK family actin-like protein [Planctomycetota bacterium]